MALILSSIGNLLCALPYLLADKKKYEGGWFTNAKQEPQFVCGNNITDILNNNGDEFARDWLGIVFIFVGFFLSGIGSSFFISFGIPFIDDNMARDNSPFALGLVMAAKTLGPALGSILGGAVLKVYVVPGTENQMEEGDLGWLGAWWIGFVVISALIAFLAPFLSLFPEKLHSTKYTDANKIDDIKECDEDFVNKYIKSTVVCFRRLLSNKVYLFNALSSLSILFGFQGFVIFGPKYFEYHFRQNASKSGILNGVSRSVGTAVGILLSGFLIGKYKFKARTLASWNLLVSCFLGVSFLIAYNLSCPKLELYGGSGGILECSATCGCLETSFQPTCSLDGQAFFLSPCHAGCTSHTEQHHEADDRSKTVSLYSECSCVLEASIALNSTRRSPDWWREDSLAGYLIPENAPVVGPLVPDNAPMSGPLVPDNDPVSGAVGDYCPVDQDCTIKFYILIGLFLVTGLLAASSKLGTQLLTFRAVDPRDKSASMVLSISSLSLFVMLPAPIIVGSLVGM